jgi:hypothetical protein
MEDLGVDGEVIIINWAVKKVSVDANCVLVCQGVG